MNPTRMDLLYAEAANCTHREEKAHTLLESIRSQIEDNSRWLEYATRLTDQAIIDYQMRAVEVDGCIEALNTSESDIPPPFTSQSMTLLETLEANITTLCYGSTESSEPLFQEAVKSGDVTLSALFIQAGVDPSANDNEAIQWAFYYGHHPVVNRLLQDPRADPSANNNEAILWASQNGHLPVVDRLLQDPRVDPSANNNLAIRRASAAGRFPVVDRLLQDAHVTSTLNATHLTAYKTQLASHATRV